MNESLSPPANEVQESSALFRALTIRERCQFVAQSAAGTGSSEATNELGRRRLATWKGQAPFDSDDHFAQLLEYMGVDETAFVEALGVTDRSMADRIPHPPPWLRLLEQSYISPAYAYLEPLPGEEEFGFLNLVEPLVEDAIDRLRMGIGELLDTHTSVPFDPNTIEDVLLANLPGPLMTRIGRTLVLELNVARLQDQLEGEDAAQRFLSFVRLLCDPDFAGAIIREYPVLARQVVVCIDQWVEVSLEFLRRLCADWPILISSFQLDAETGPLVRLSGGAGDTHRSGRSVMIAEFESGFRVVYKPKGLVIDKHFFDLVEWLNRAGCDPPLSVFQTLDCGDHGWAEFVEREECTQLEQVRRFYRRQGAYLGLLYILNAGDFHFENVIAGGEHPMLIDLETLMQPRFERFEGNRADLAAQRDMAESVLSIGLLPMRLWSMGDYDGIDISGLGGAAGQLSPDRIPELTAAGTDAMRYVRNRTEISGDANRPILDGVETSATDYVDEIVDGFESMYRLVAERKADLLSPAGPIFAMAADEIRVLLRPTRTYGQLLYESFHPDLLRDSADRDLFFARIWLAVLRRDYMTDAVIAEWEDIQQGDIPVFSSRPDTLDLLDAQGRPIRNVLTQTGIAAVKDRLKGLSEQDLARQTWYIRASLASLSEDGGEPAFAAKPIFPTATRVGHGRILDAARAAADYLCSTSLGGDTDATWIGLERQDGRHWTISPLGADLYGGTAGVALFLAYAGVILGAAQYEDTARRAYAWFRQQINELGSAYPHVGGFEGWGGALYTSTHLGALWHDEDIISDTDGILQVMREVLEGNDVYDVAQGCAGAISSILQLHRWRPADTLLETAHLFGERLVSGAWSYRRGAGWASRRFGDVALTGYAYGVAGIALALMQLHAASGEAIYLETAINALEYERSQFSPEAGNWPDLRPPSPSTDANLNQGLVYRTAWCHGAVGIGLARLQALQYVSDGQLEEEAATAVATTFRHGFGQSHCLCHGDLGSLELVLQASRSSVGPISPAEVDHVTAMILDDLDTKGWRCGGPNGILLPGLMLGVAGIGYQLLRLAEPEIAPCVMMLEPPAV